MAVTESVKKYWIQEIQKAIRTKVQQLLVSTPTLEHEARLATQAYVLSLCGAQEDWDNLQVIAKAADDAHAQWSELCNQRSKISMTLDKKLQRLQEPQLLNHRRPYNLSIMDELIEDYLSEGMRAVSPVGQEVATLLEQANTVERMINIITAPKELTDAVRAFCEKLDIDLE